MTHVAYLIAAYISIWVLLLLYVANLGRRNRILQREVDELREFLRRQGETATRQESDDA